MKSAPDVMLDLCGQVHQGGQVREMSEDERRERRKEILEYYEGED